MLTRAAAQCHCTAPCSPQSVLLDWQRWRSPADDFIHVISPPPMSRELLSWDDCLAGLLWFDACLALGKLTGCRAVAALFQTTTAGPSRVRRRSPGPGSAAAGSPRTMSPLSMSKSPSNDSLSALPAGGLGAGWPSGHVLGTRAGSSGRHGRKAVCWAGSSGRHGCKAVCWTRWHLTGTACCQTQESRRPHALPLTLPKQAWRCAARPSPSVAS